MMIAYHRGRMPADNGIKGGLMAATGLSAEEAQQRVQGTAVVMACDNSPSSTTVSGPFFSPSHLLSRFGFAALQTCELDFEFETPASLLLMLIPPICCDDQHILLFH